MTEDHETFSHHITLLRHGESTGNAQGVFQGHAEFDLTEKGEAQSRALAARWKEEGQEFTQVISNPQSRARQTAEIITEILTAPLELDSNWKEIDNGMLAFGALQRSGSLAEGQCPRKIIFRLSIIQTC